MYKVAYTISCLLCSVLIHHYFYMPNLNEDVDVLKAGALTRPLIIFSKVVDDLLHGGAANRRLTEEVERNERILNEAKMKFSDDKPIKKDNIKKSKKSTQRKDDNEAKSDIKQSKKSTQQKNTRAPKIDIKQELKDYQSYIERNVFPIGELDQLKQYFRENFDQKRNYLMLAIADKNYADFSANFALRATQLKLKVAFICLDADVQLTLARVGHSCHAVKLLDGHLNSGDTANVHGSNYIAVTNLKTLFTSVALFAGFHTLYTDVDISLFRDPAPFMRRTEAKVDAYISDDAQMSNCGFGLAFSNDHTKLWYARSWMKFKESTSERQQIIWNEVLRDLEKTKKLVARHLDPERFPCGDFFFRTDRREFSTGRGFSCVDCVAVHNNYMGTPQAKRYRMRETGLWYLPRPHTSKKRYLKMHMDWSYDSAGTDVAHLQRKALTIALRRAAQLGRVLVLPAFRCCDYVLPRNRGKRNCANTLAECSLLHVLDIERFENHIGEDGYREHTFVADKAASMSQSPIIREQEVNEGHVHYDILNIRWIMDRLPVTHKIKGEIDDFTDEKYSTDSYEQFRDNKIFK